MTLIWPLCCRGQHPRWALLHCSFKPVIASGVLKTLEWRTTERHKETGGNLSTVSRTIFACQTFIAPVVLWRASAASSAERGLKSGLQLPIFLTCGGRPESHQSPRVRAVCGGLQRRRGAAGEGIRPSERPAEACVHTCRSPAEERGERKRQPALSE